MRAIEPMIAPFSSDLMADEITVESDPRRWALPNGWIPAGEVRSDATQGKTEGGAFNEDARCTLRRSDPIAGRCAGRGRAAIAGKRSGSIESDHRHAAHGRPGIEIHLRRFHRTHRHHDLSELVGGIAGRPEILFSDLLHGSADRGAPAGRPHAHAVAQVAAGWPLRGHV